MLLAVFYGSSVQPTAGAVEALMKPLLVNLGVKRESGDGVARLNIYTA
jgi:hypothetical protein